ncbi:DUF4097 domain-containing protein [Bacillus nakamurai]|uniref:LiaG family protein n=1 Tax=Bacillus nakamurai TaxID=1793963 RepID=UPI001E3DF05A|nr:DUF4097 domain-containing protein [Bacillus nakamurai]MCC9023052.1 DUF4097 domain-containing protein [Bacillus nakamurai]
MKPMFGKLLITAGVLICCLFLVKDVFAERLFPLNGTEAESASVSPREISSLAVSSEQMDVKIIAETRNDIAAHVTGQSGKLFVRSQGKTLNLTAKEKGFQFLNVFHRSILIVRIPYEYKQDITVRSSSGNIEVDGNRGLGLAHLGVRSSSGSMTLKKVRAESFEAKGLSGHLIAYDLAAKTANVRSSSGNVNLHHVAGAFNVLVTSGNVNASLQEANAPASVRLTSGSAAISLPKDGDFTVNAESASGNIKSSYSFDETHQEGERLTGVKGNGAQPIEIKVTSGNVALQ